jgi:hypothetical protein
VSRPARVAPPENQFAHTRAQLGFDQPGWCVPRHAEVLSALEASTRLTPGQARTMMREQRRYVTIRDDGRAVLLGGQLRDALGCLREEARRHGRLVALGQAWAGSNRLMAIVTAHQPRVVAQILSSVVAGEVLCRLLDDVEDRRVLDAGDERLLRHAWRAAHPPPAYFRRPIRD